MESFQNKTQPANHPSAMETGLANSSRPTSSLADSIGEPRSHLRIRATSYCSDGRRTGVSTHFASNDTVCISNDQTGQSIVVASNQSTRDALASLVQRETELERQEAAAVRVAMENASLQAMIAEETRRFLENDFTLEMAQEEHNNRVNRSRAQSTKSSTKSRARANRSRSFIDQVVGLTDQDAHVMYSYLKSFAQTAPTGSDQLFSADQHMAAVINNTMQSAVSSRPTVSAQADVNDSTTTSRVIAETLNLLIPSIASDTGQTKNNSMQASSQSLQTASSNGHNSRAYFGMSRFLDRQSTDTSPKKTPKRSRKSTIAKNSRNGVRSSNAANDQQNVVAVMANGNANVLSKISAVTAAITPVDNFQRHQETAQKKDFRSRFAKLEIPASVREGIRRVAERRRSGQQIRSTGLPANRSRSAPCNKTDEELIAFLKEPLALAKAAELEAMKKRMMEPPPKRKSRAKSSTAAATTGRSAPIDAETVQQRTAGQGDTQSNCSRSKSTPSDFQAEDHPLDPALDAKSTILDSESKHITTDSLTGIEQTGRSYVRLDMPLGQALQEVPLRAVAGQLLVQKRMESAPSFAPTSGQLEGVAAAKPKKSRAKRKVEAFSGNEGLVSGAELTKKKRAPPKKKPTAAQKTDVTLTECEEQRMPQQQEVDPMVQNITMEHYDQQLDLNTRPNYRQIMQAFDEQNSTETGKQTNYQNYLQSQTSRRTTLPSVEILLPPNRNKSCEVVMPSGSNSLGNYYYPNDMAYHEANMYSDRSQSTSSSASSYQHFQAAMNSTIEQHNEPEAGSLGGMGATNQHCSFIDNSQSCPTSQVSQSSGTNGMQNNSVELAQAFAPSNSLNGHSADVQVPKVLEFDMSVMEQESFPVKDQEQLMCERNFIEETELYAVQQECNSIAYYRATFHHLYENRPDESAQPQKVPHHDFRYEDGKIVPVLDSSVLPDGSLQLSDGSILYSDRTIMRPNGIRIKPDGSVFPPDGATVDNFGLVRTASGEFLLSLGYVLRTDGMFLRPDATIFNPPKIIMSLANVIDMIGRDPVSFSLGSSEEVSTTAQYAAQTIERLLANQSQESSTSQTSISTTSKGSINTKPVDSYNMSFSHENSHNNSVITHHLANDQISSGCDLNLQVPPVTEKILQTNETDTFNACNMVTVENEVEYVDAVEHSRMVQEMTQQNFHTTTTHGKRDRADREISNAEATIVQTSTPLGQSIAYIESQPLVGIDQQGVFSSRSQTITMMSNGYISGTTTDQSSHFAVRNPSNMTVSSEQTQQQTIETREQPVGHTDHAIIKSTNALPQPDQDQISYVQYLPNQLSLTNHGKVIYQGNQDFSQHNSQMTTSSLEPPQLLDDDQFASVGQLVEQKKKARKANAKRKKSAIGGASSYESPDFVSRSQVSPLIDTIFEKVEEMNEQKEQKVSELAANQSSSEPAKIDTVRDVIDCVLEQVMSGKREKDVQRLINPDYVRSLSKKNKSQASRQRAPTPTLTTRAVMVQQSLINTCQTGAAQRQHELALQKQQELAMQKQGKLPVRHPERLQYRNGGQVQPNLGMQDYQQPVMINVQPQQQQPTRPQLLQQMHQSPLITQNDLMHDQQQQIQFLNSMNNAHPHQNTTDQQLSMQSAQQQRLQQQQQQSSPQMIYQEIHHQVPQFPPSQRQQKSQKPRMRSQQRVVKVVQQQDPQNAVIQQSAPLTEYTRDSQSPLQIVQRVQDLASASSPNESSLQSSRPPSHVMQASIADVHQNFRSLSANQNTCVVQVVDQQSIALHTQQMQTVRIPTQEEEEMKILRIVKEKLAQEEEAERNIAVSKQIPKVNAITRVKHMRETINFIASHGPLTPREALDLKDDDDVDEYMGEYIEFYDRITKEMEANPCAAEIVVIDVLNHPELEAALHGRFRKRLAAVREGRTTQTYCPKKKKGNSTVASQETKRKSETSLNQHLMNPTNALPEAFLTNETNLCLSQTDEFHQPPLSAITETSSIGPSPLAPEAIEQSLWASSQQHFSQDLMSEHLPPFEDFLAKSTPSNSSNAHTSSGQNSSAPSVSMSVDHASSYSQSCLNNDPMPINFLEDDPFDEKADKAPVLSDDIMLSGLAPQDDFNDLVGFGPFDEEVSDDSTQRNNNQIPEDDLFMSLRDSTDLLDINFSNNDDKPSTPSVGILEDQFPSYDTPYFSSFGSPRCSPMELHVDIPLQNDTVTSSSDLIDITLNSTAQSSPLPLPVLPQEEAPLIEALFRPTPELLATCDQDMTVSDLLGHRTTKKRVAKPRPTRSAKLPRTNFKTMAREQAAELSIAVVEQLQYKTTRKRGNDFTTSEEIRSGFHLMDQLQEKELSGQSSSVSPHITVRELISKHVANNTEPVLQKPAALSQVIEKLEEERNYLMSKSEAERQLMPHVHEEIAEPIQNEPPQRRGFIHWPGSAGYGELTLPPKKSARSASTSLIDRPSTVATNELSLSDNTQPI